MAEFLSQDEINGLLEDVPTAPLRVAKGEVTYVADVFIELHSLPSNMLCKIRDIVLVDVAGIATSLKFEIKNKRIQTDFYTQRIQ